MFGTRVLRQRQPLIRFLGKRVVPQTVDHTPHVHPASPTKALPDSFASYRSKALQHGPLGGQKAPSFATASGSTGRSGHSYGSVEPAKGQYFDRDELPVRFRRTHLTIDEMEAIDSGGGSLWS